MSDDESDNAFSTLITSSIGGASDADSESTLKVVSGKRRKVVHRWRILLFGVPCCMAVVLILAVAVGLGVGLSRSSHQQDAKDVLTSYPVIDGLAYVW